MRASVVLPHPLSPTTANVSPCSTEKLSPSSAVKRLSASSTCSSGPPLGPEAFLRVPKPFPESRPVTREYLFLSSRASRRLLMMRNPTLCRPSLPVFSQVLILKELVDEQFRRRWGPLGKG